MVVSLVPDAAGPRAALSTGGGGGSGPHGGFLFPFHTSFCPFPFFLSAFLPFCLAVVPRALAIPEDGLGVSLCWALPLGMGSFPPLPGSTGALGLWPGLALAGGASWLCQGWAAPVSRPPLSDIVTVVFLLLCCRFCAGSFTYVL